MCPKEGKFMFLLPRLDTQKIKQGFKLQTPNFANVFISYIKDVKKISYRHIKLMSMYNYRYKILTI